MLVILALVTTAFAGNIESTNINHTEPAADGTCSPTLWVRAIGSVQVFEDDGQPIGLGNHTLFLDHTAPTGCESINGLPDSDQCGPVRTYGGGEALWVIDLDTVDEGEFGTFLMTESVESGPFNELTILAEVSWSCGECVLAADINGDGVVTITDYLDLLTAMGTAVSEGDPRDVDGDGFVGGLDLVEVVSSLGDECPEGL